MQSQGGNHHLFLLISLEANMGQKETSGPGVVKKGSEQSTEQCWPLLGAHTSEAVQFGQPDSKGRKNNLEGHRGHIGKLAGDLEQDCKWKETLIFNSQTEGESGVCTVNPKCGNGGGTTARCFYITLLRSSFTTNRMKHFPTEFRVKLWNSLPHDVVEAKSIKRMI